MANTKFTVVTVCYNSEATIESCMKSVQLQEPNLYEHVIVDGASNDRTLALITEMKNTRVNVISEKDFGIYDAMNKGLNNSKGEYVIFLNSDDCFNDGDILKEYCAIIEKNNPDIIYSNLNYIDKNGKVVRSWKSGFFSNLKLYFGWMPPHPTVAVRRETLIASGGFNCDYAISGDYDLMLRLLQKKRLKISYINVVSVNMLIGGVSNGSIKNMFKKTLEDYRIIRSHNLLGFVTLFCKQVRKLPQLWIKHEFNR